MSESPATTAAGRGSVFRAIRWSVAASGIGQGGRILTFLLLAQFLSPADFGLLAMAYVVVGFLNVIRNLGTGAAVIQRESLEPRLLDSVFWLNIAAGLLLALGVLAFARLGAIAFAEPRLTPVLQALALGFVIGTAGVLPRALLRRQLKFHWIAAAETISMLTYAGIALPLAVLGVGVWSLVIATLVSDLVLTATSWMGARWRPRMRCDVEALRSIWTFSANLTLSQIASYVFWKADRIIVGRFLGADALGIYAIAHRLLGFAVRFLVPQLHAVLFPALARLNDHGIRSGFVRAECGIALVVFPLLIGLSILGPGFVRAFLGPEWALAAVLIPLLGVRYVLEAVLQGVGILYQLKARTDLFLYWQLGSGVVFLASYFIGLQWGVPGVAAAQAIAMVLLTYPGLAIPLRLIGQKLGDLVHALTPHILANAAMSGAAVLYLAAVASYGLDAWMELAGAALIGATAYVVATFLVRPPALSDLYGLLTRYG